jgi:chromosome segregation ATPase
MEEFQEMRKKESAQLAELEMRIPKLLEHMSS